MQWGLNAEERAARIKAREEIVRARPIRERIMWWPRRMVNGKWIWLEKAVVVSKDHDGCRPWEVLTLSAYAAREMRRARDIQEQRSWSAAKQAARIP